MAIFHVKYPRRRGFLKWDELGCLARALGFQTDVFRDGVTEEIAAENDGMPFSEFLKMLEYRLLYKSLHHTVNLHTAEWNMAAINKALLLLIHKALTFEEAHNVRIAYQLYEAGDMKGMTLDKHTLLRSLKMCGRTIAPMKLMHRVKHMQEEFEEEGRIQLSEYFDLILWCDIYVGFNPKEVDYPEGEENRLFQLVDFEKLLSHHDERLAWALNTEYLREEWDFGMENLGTKHMFKEPPITNDTRIQQTKLHKRKYRHLKNEVGSSQKRVYRAHAGYIRDRPITAPDLSMYAHKPVEEVVTGTTAHEAYQSVRRRLKSAPPSTKSATAFADRPLTRDYQRQQTPPAVTGSDITDVETKMNSLKFDMITLESKYEIERDDKMDYFLPGYREKLARRPPPEPTPEPEPEPPEPIHWTKEVIEHLVHPDPRLPPSHARQCDARYRGWQPVKVKKGPHHVLVTSSYENSPQGQMYSKLRQRTFAPVKHLHKDYLFRYTSSAQVEKGKGRLGEERPVTAPGNLQSSRRFRGSISSSASSLNNGQYPPPLAFNFTSAPREEADDDCPSEQSQGHSHIEDSNNGAGSVSKQDIEDSSGKRHSMKSPHQEKNTFENSNYPIDKMTYMKSLVISPEKQCKVQIQEYESETSIDEQKDVDDLVIPVPPMQHTRPKRIEVGHIGTISLLEKIEESQDLEDRFSQTSHKQLDQMSDTRSGREESFSPSLKLHQDVQEPVSPPRFVVTGTPEELLQSEAPPQGVPTEVSEEQANPPLTMEKASRPVTASDNSESVYPESEASEESRGRSSELSNVPNVHEPAKTSSRGSRRQVVWSGSRKPVMSASSQCSSASSMKRRLLGTNSQRPSINSSNEKYFRLVQRVNTTISRDLKIRLLTHSQG